MIDKTFRPINQLARIVISGGSDVPDVPPFTDISADFVRRESKRLRKETGKKLGECKTIVCRDAGYDDFNHFVRVLQSRGEYHNALEANQKKRVSRFARKFAQNMAETLAKEPSP